MSGQATASLLGVEQGRGVFGQENISFGVSGSSSVRCEEGCQATVLNEHILESPGYTHKPLDPGASLQAQGSALGWGVEKPWEPHC